MHIAIDDTYTQNNNNESEYITGNRRTNVAIIFKDEEVEFIRNKISEYLDEIQKSFCIGVKEFHFADIYNKNPPWDKLPDDKNLAIFEFFSTIYSTYRWPVIIQTVDERTLADHNVKISGRLFGFNLDNKSDLSLLMLLFKIKWRFKDNPIQLNILIDEGKGKSGRSFGKEIFHDYNNIVNSKFSSSTEVILQIADFIAYMINRVTNISIKKNKSKTDVWFLNLANRTSINSEDLSKLKLPLDFKVNDVDEEHKKDRQSKGIKNP